MPPRCAKCATPAAVPVTPSTSSSAREHDDEGARAHRDRREQQHELAVGKVDAVGEEQAVHAARGAHRGIGLGAHPARHHEVADRRREHAHEVVGGEKARAEQALEVGAEHVQREHVEEDVREVRVQEAVGDELPELEVGRRRWARCRRPQREPFEKRHRARHLEQKDGDVGDEQRLGSWSHEWRYAPQDTVRETIAASSATSTGLVRWRAKPASFARRTSSSAP